MEIGSQLGHFEILGQLGAGGMGEVYLARDGRLGRKVAIKVLPAEFASDPERLARFEQEARAAAALNHPHIAVVHEIGSEQRKDGSSAHFMVQEYLEGESLGQRLEQGAVPLERALDLAVEIIEALAAAHSAGIIHRDLKPDNIFVTEQGHAKVLDFGLAKLAEATSPAGSSVSMSPTALGTIAGQMMGTAGYMAPEQVRGEEVDYRADLFAFGCVLYAMVTGRQAFAGKNIHDTLSRILSDEPISVLQINELLPAELQRIVRKSLAKDLERRYQTANDLNVDLRQLADDVATGGTLGLAAGGQDATDTALIGWSTRVLVVATVLMGGLVGLLTWLATRPTVPPPSPTADFEVLLPEGVELAGGSFRSIAISPDGAQIVVVANNQLWRRNLGDPEMTPVRGTHGEKFVGSPFFSPDGHDIGFYADFGLQRVDAAGGLPQLLVADERAFVLYGGSWADDGNIYFGRGPRGIWRVSDKGGEPENVVALEIGSARAPQLLPGGTWVLMTFKETPNVPWDEASIVVGSLATGERRELFRGGTDARYLPSGHIVYEHDSRLFARPFDVHRLEVTGEAIPVRDGIRQAPGTAGGALGPAHWDASDSGTLVYVPRTGGGESSRLVWYSLDGKGEPLPLPRTGATVGAVQLSPAGDRIAMELFDENGSRIVTYQIGQASVQPFAVPGRFPVWAPEGDWLYLPRDAGADYDIYRGQVASTVAPMPVLTRAGDQMVTDANRERLLFEERSQAGDRDIWTLALVEGAEPELVLGGPEDTGDAVFSPDGKWIAYRSGGTANPLGTEIWIQEYPGPGAKLKVSKGDVAATPLWTEAGLFYDGGGKWTVVEDLDPGPGVIPAPARVLLSRVLLPPRGGRAYDVSADGERLLTSQAQEGRDRRAGNSIRVVLNWFQELAQRVPTGR